VCGRKAEGRGPKEAEGTMPTQAKGGAKATKGDWGSRKEDFAAEKHEAREMTRGQGRSQKRV